MPEIQILSANTSYPPVDVIGTAASLQVADHEMGGAHEYAHFYDNPVFWVAVSFILVVCLLFKPLSKFAKNALQARVDRIIKNINDAANLKDDAQKLLADYERKFLNVDDEVQAILLKSQKEIEDFKQESLKKLEFEMKLREREVEERLNAAQHEAVQQIVVGATDVTMKTIKQILAQNLNAKNQDLLIEKSINSISKMANFK